jgi:hypothetical protein
MFMRLNVKEVVLPIKDWSSMSSEQPVHSPGAHGPGALGPGALGPGAHSPSTLRAELRAAYTLLASKHLNLHARDFWRMRAAKQQALVLADPLLHEHTAIRQYVQWHGEDGSRLRAELRGTARCLACAS